MLDTLPGDVLGVIRLHLMAMRIQSMFQKRLYRHTRDPAWKKLRSLLCKCLTTRELDLLTNCALVRKEWRSEPESWIYELDAHPDNGRQIAHEIETGLWTCYANMYERTS